MLFTSILTAAMVGVAQAIDVQVVYVGKNPVNDAVGTKYWPEKITAAPGTMVQFQFWAGNHTVTQSNFDNPCKPITQNANGTSVSPIKSGFMPVEESADIGQIPIYTIMINDTSPLWFYCGQGPHCANGMSLVINEKTESGKTLEAYKSLSATTGGTVPPTGGNNSVPDTGSSPGSGSDAPAPGSGDDSSPGGDVPGSIPSNPDSSIGDGERPQSGAAFTSLSWAVLLGAAVMFAL